MRLRHTILIMNCSKFLNNKGYTLREIGLHLRLESTLAELVERARRLNVDLFQCFFVHQATGAPIRFSSEEVAQFQSARREYFKDLYLHGSYWINLASLEYNGIRAFEHELRQAKRLEFTHMILHPGNAKGAKNKIQGIDALVAILNDTMKREKEVQLVLENAVHGKMTIGSDLEDFAILKSKLDFPDRISFCVDTAHAYAYGYDITNPVKLEEFIALLDRTMGIDRIVLIHLNDTMHKLGSGIDQHVIPGQGRLGQEVLQRFVLHPRLQHIPLLMELPVLEEDEQAEVLEMVRGWHR